MQTGYLKGVPLRDAHFSREICLRRRRNLDLSPLTQRFVEILRRVAADDPAEAAFAKAQSPGRRLRATAWAAVRVLTTC